MFDVAIIGMAGRFPGADDIDAFWRNVQEGVESIAFFSEEELDARGVGEDLRETPGYVNAGGRVDGVDRFDAAFFGYSPREAELMDPQHRLFLETVWAALEDGGYDPRGIDDTVGVFAGSGMNAYLYNVLANPDGTLGGFHTRIANDKDFLATRVSYDLGLTGPSLNVNTACSTSLVAVHLACQSLIAGECDVAVAGGVTLAPRVGYVHEEGGILSADGHCRPFDASATGTVEGDGVGAVVLRLKEDAVDRRDRIDAVIRGSAVNNDGNLKVGYTAPGVEGQSDVIDDALAVAGIAADTIDYVEAHGTGTEMGDPIEIRALTRAFARHTDAETSDRETPVRIGSVKGNVGHLDAAAGVTGLMKAVLALKQGVIPPTAHFEAPNPEIDFTSTPFRVADTRHPWPDGDAPRRAAVSSFGIGGTNAHAVLEEAPPVPTPEPERTWYPLPLSARTESALSTAAHDLADRLDDADAASTATSLLADASYTLMQGRHPMEYRTSVAARTPAGAADALRNVAAYARHSGTASRPVVFLFPGQGTQHVGMAQALYDEETVFRDAVDACARHLRDSLGVDLRDVLYPDADASDRASSPPAPKGDAGDANEADGDAAERLQQTALTQPALFTIEYALARLWQSWGLEPDALVGHSIGEYVAATLAGVFQRDDALDLVAERGRLMQAQPSGSMLSVALPADALDARLGDDVDLAIANAPRLSVAAGPDAAIDRLEQRLQSDGVDTQRLHTSHAFHSARMQGAVAPFTRAVNDVARAAPSTRLISNLTGTWMRAEEAQNPTYWAQHLRKCVRFHEGVQTMIDDLEDPVFLEVGPGNGLGTLLRQTADRHAETDAHTASPRTVASLPHPASSDPASETLAEAVGRLWTHGAPVDPDAYHGGARQPVRLPSYPFERQRHWVDADADADAQAWVVPETETDADAARSTLGRTAPDARVAPRTDIEKRVAAVWEDILGVEDIGVHENFFDLGGHSLMATRLATRLKEVYPVDLSLEALFETPTVAEVSSHIYDQLLAMVDDLSEEEVEAMLA